MVEEIATDGTKKVLLEGTGKKVPPSSPQPNRRRADVVVENATEKRYLWTARAFAIIFAVSLCCNIILTYVIVATMPLYRVEPYLLSFADKGEQIYEVQPVKKIREYKYLTELFVREYVLLRNTFINDIDEMKRRWGKGSSLFEMSDQNLYKNFWDSFATRTLEQIRKYNITRNVKIVSATEVGMEKGQTWWEVEFRTSDMGPSYGTPEVTRWVADIRIGYRPKRVQFKERLKNPLGFTVFKYVARKKEGK